MVNQLFLPRFTKNGIRPVLTNIATVSLIETERLYSVYVSCRSLVEIRRIIRPRMLFIPATNNDAEMLITLIIIYCNSLLEVLLWALSSRRSRAIPRHKLTINTQTSNNAVNIYVIMLFLTLVVNLIDKFSQNTSVGSAARSISILFSPHHLEFLHRLFTFTYF
jgi:hypothetical protein